MDIKILPKDALEDKSLWDLLKYYQQCTIANYHDKRKYEDIIRDIEYEIRERCQ